MTLQALSQSTPYARLRHNPEAMRDGVALCLSGGGFRNALFHLGAVRRLNELGILCEVTTVSAVSGGTTLAAHLAATASLWNERPLDSRTWEHEIAAPFRRFTSENVGARAVLKGWLPWYWDSNRPVATLAKTFEQRGLGRMLLQELPSRPEFLFCATDLVGGTQWLLGKSSLTPMTVATAAAISSWLLPPYASRKGHHVTLADGGLADWRGVEPVWRTHRLLLVSDGGDAYQPQWGRSMLWSITRLAGTISHHAQLFQKRWLLASMLSDRLSGAYWGIESASTHYQPEGSARLPGYSAALARDIIGTIRIDYDCCSDAEAAVLENHGYLLADAAAQTHLTGFRTADLRIPHPAWLSEPKVRYALRNSARKVFLGRGRLRALLGWNHLSLASPFTTDVRSAPPSPMLSRT
jgi:NTE family protein